MDFNAAMEGCGASLFDFGTGKGFGSVCIDSREAGKAALFVALSGNVNDGHSFVQKAFDAGACAALVDRAKIQKFALLEAAKRAQTALLAVDDTLRGLQDLAASYLERFPRLLRIGITGSSGKTTAKELCAAMIGAEKKVVCNEGNLNSETGLPLSVFAVRKEHQVCVFELGMNRKGEIAELAGVLKPDIALVNNVGTAHIGLIGSRREIALEKKAIFSRFTGSQTAFVPEGEEFSALLA
jgi:UDP-N-acetylmuramoyl-tripeptide--D-alanyl-D-alanine ligase